MMDIRRFSRPPPNNNRRALFHEATRIHTDKSPGLFVHGVCVVMVERSSVSLTRVYRTICEARHAAVQNTPKACDSSGVNVLHKGILTACIPPKRSIVARTSSEHNEEINLNLCCFDLLSSSSTIKSFERPLQCNVKLNSEQNLSTS